MAGRQTDQRPKRSLLVFIVALFLSAIASEASLAAAVPQPVSRYAPLVWLHPKEQYQPVSAIYFISRSRLVWNRGLLRRDVIDPQISVSEMPRLGVSCEASGTCYEADDDGSTWLSSQHTRPHNAGRDGLGKYHGFSLNYGGPEKGPGGAAPAYYIYRPRRYITYWLHYTFSSQFGIKHEGDWEHITVLLDGKNRARRLQYFFHSCDDWAGMDGDRRPEVFSALRSHATYLRAGPHAGTCKGRDRTAKGTTWRTWRSLRNAEEEPWYGFGGAWGSMAKLSNRSGPLGPSRYKANCADGPCP
jgi:hypothetical protein